MSKQEEKLQPKSPAQPASMTKGDELGEAELNQVSGGIVITKVTDASSTKLLLEGIETTPPAKP